jgi:hypothetical protein
MLTCVIQRNFKAQGRFTDDNKKRIDDNFKKDLYNQCAHESEQEVCDGIADIYYEAVCFISAMLKNALMYAIQVRIFGSKRREAVEAVAQRA